MIRIILGTHIAYEFLEVNSDYYNDSFGLYVCAYACTPPAIYCGPVIGHFC